MAGRKSRANLRDLEIETDSLFRLILDLRVLPRTFSNSCFDICFYKVEEDSGGANWFYVLAANLAIELSGRCLYKSV